MAVIVKNVPGRSGVLLLEGAVSTSGINNGSRSHALARPQETTFIGRDVEGATVDQILDEATNGQCRIVMVLGEHWRPTVDLRLGCNFRQSAGR